MKFNKWTLGLAALGAISLASAARAEEQKMVAVTAASATVISGAVDVGAQYNMGNYGPNAGVPIGTSGSKVDIFSLNNLTISLDKSQDESPWASGYHADVNIGTDAVGLGFNGAGTATSGMNTTAAIRQAYVVLRTPVGNGIDWKVVAMDDIIGYEGNTDAANPNGSLHNIAGVCNETRNVAGLMPHPERASEAILGCDDGRLVFESLLAWLNSRKAAKAA